MKLITIPLSIALSLLTLPTLAQNWVKIAEGSTATIFINPESIQNWSNEYGVEGTSADILIQLPDGQSRPGLFVADCVNLALYEVTGTGGQGNAIESGEGTIGETVLDRMCAMR